MIDDVIADADGSDAHYTGITIYPDNEYQKEREYLYLHGICNLNEEQRLKVLRNFSKFKVFWE